MTVAHPPPAVVVGVKGPLLNNASRAALICCGQVDVRTDLSVLTCLTRDSDRVDRNMDRKVVLSFAAHQIVPGRLDVWYVGVAAASELRGAAGVAVAQIGVEILPHGADGRTQIRPRCVVVPDVTGQRSGSADGREDTRRDRDDQPPVAWATAPWRRLARRGDPAVARALYRHRGRGRRLLVRVRRYVHGSRVADLAGPQACATSRVIHREPVLVASASVGLVIL